MKGTDATRKAMFGYPVYFVNGNMFSGLFEDKLFLRIPEEMTRSLLARDIELSLLEPMKGRPMKNYRVIPSDLMHDDQAFGKILESSLTYTRTLPEKKK
jgi:TfoX/Sxy family transcriptional regulator of competence genes